jgi:hypothetical protein
MNRLNVCCLVSVSVCFPISFRFRVGNTQVAGGRASRQPQSRPSYTSYLTFNHSEHWGNILSIISNKLGNKNRIYVCQHNRGVSCSKLFVCNVIAKRKLLQIALANPAIPPSTKEGRCCRITTNSDYSDSCLCSLLKSTDKVFLL